VTAQPSGVGLARAKVIAARHRDVVGRLLGPEPRLAGGPLAHRDQPETDQLDLVLVAVGHPLVELVAPRVSLLGLAQPARRVGRGLEGLALEHVCVAPRTGEPFGQAVAPVLPGDMGP